MERKRFKDILTILFLSLQTAGRGASRTPAPSRHQEQQPQVNGYQPSFLNATYNYNAYPPGPVGVQQGVPTRRVGNSSQPQVPELGLADQIARTEIGGLGLEAAIAKSQTSMIDRYVVYYKMCMHVPLFPIHCTWRVANILEFCHDHSCWGYNLGQYVASILTNSISRLLQVE